MAALKRECERLRAELASAMKRIAELEKALADALRAQKRQVAPFRREDAPSPEPANITGSPVEAQGPRRPGRKGGHKAAHRERLAPTHSQEVSLPRGPEKRPCCPECGALLFRVKRRVQQVVDLPPTGCVVTDVTLEAGSCPKCRTDITTLNPLTGSAAAGAASVQIGPRILALAALLHHERAVPMGAVAELVTKLTGLELETSTLVRAMHRLADRAVPQFMEILEAIRKSPNVNMDESGWRVNGVSASVHVAVGQDATAYKITPGRGSDVPAATLGPDFAGVLSTDGSRIYDDLPHGARQTCLAHLARHARAAEKVEQARGKAFPRKVLAWVRTAVEFKAHVGVLSREEATQGIDTLRTELLDMCGGASDRYGYESQGLANYMYNRQDFWLTFLERPGLPGLDGTNNAAERALRPVVRCRKVSGGSRSWKGAETHAVLASVIRTHRQRGLDAEHALVAILKPTRSWAKRTRPTHARLQAVT